MWPLEGGELVMSILPGTQTPSITGVTVALVQTWSGRMSHPRGITYSL